MITLYGPWKRGPYGAIMPVGGYAMLNVRGFVVVAIVTGLIASCAIANRARAEEAKPTYQEVLKECGKLWKGSDERKAQEKGAGREGWQAFLAMCKTDKGFQKKSKKNAA